MPLFSSRHRPVHLGRLPMERLARAAQAPALPEKAAAVAGEGPLADVAGAYLALFAQWRDGPAAPERAPVCDDLEARAQDLKAACYFMDADVVGLAPLDGAAALVILVEHGRLPEADNRARGWCAGGQAVAAALRAGEIAVVAGGYIRQLGWAARAHCDQPGASDVDLARLAVQAGVVRVERGRLVNPFIGAGFALAAVTTDYPLATDRPLAANGGRGLGWWLGLGGSEPALERWLRRRRRSDLSAYPMERIRRVETPTTLVHEDEIPRVPKRAAFFERALKGDLGPKAQAERTRFATKHPFAAAMTPLIAAMVPHQDGQIAPAQDALGDPAANARAIKSLSYLLGADLTGICEAREFAWYSHDDDGTPIEPYHRYAVVMLIDQGHETMEGSSGDDWISGAQSMRAYLRGAEIAGVMAEMLRRLGHGARAQTNRDSDVLHIPLVLLAGLGEMSRIGELVLNPYVGPRFKSVVLTTDLPLALDRPIDFGLQDMCSKCLKCARECPCDAIPYGPKVMFNGYETWKPDVQRCTAYRLTNMRGSACGRCMKTCPYNHEGLLVHRFFLWLAIHAPWSRRWLAALDDRVGNGNVNWIKRWWQDLEVVEGRVRRPKLANARDLDLGKTPDPAKQKIAHYPAAAMPPPDCATPFPPDRKRALAEPLENPQAALARRRQDGPRPVNDEPPPLKGEP